MPAKVIVGAIPQLAHVLLGSGTLLGEARYGGGRHGGKEEGAKGEEVAERTLTRAEDGVKASSAAFRARSLSASSISGISFVRRYCGTE